MIVTPLVGAVLGALLMKLSFNVIGLRRQNKVGLGTGGIEALERAIRAQANFTEYVPICLILLTCLELNGTPRWLVSIPGLFLILGRALHAKGICEPPPHFTNRVRGMMLTFAALGALVGLNLVFVLLKLFG